MFTALCLLRCLLGQLLCWGGVAAGDGRIGDESVDAEAACACADEGEGGCADHSDEFKAAVGDEYACADVCEEVGAEHLQRDDEADPWGGESDEDEDAATKFDDCGDCTAEAWKRYAHAGEGFCGAGECPFVEFLPAVGNEDDAEQDAGKEQ